MKKILLFTCTLFCAVFVSNAQVFNTSSTLQKGNFSVGIQPGLYVDGNPDFNLFIHGGAGIKSGIDLGLKLGFAGSATYIGGDVEFAISKRFSVSAGAHSWGNFGLDGTALFTFPITSGVKLYAGLDTDIIFADPDIVMPFWIPVGLEIGMKSNMSFLFESEIKLTDAGSNYLGGGLMFYF